MSEEKTLKKLEKRRRFEEKQFAKLSRLMEKGQPAYYFAVTIILIVLVDLLDNFTTSSTGNITSSIITDFFVNGSFFGRSYTFEEGLSIHNTLTLLCSLVAIGAPFYKSLGDKYGQKPLLAISTCGMAGGMLIIYLSKTYPVFLLGNLIMTFFLGADIQILYVLEEAPSKHRAKIYSILKATGALGVAFIPLLRNLAMHNDAAQWRQIFMLPGIAGIIISVLVVLLAKETRVFVKQKHEYLSMPLEERIEIERQKKLEKKADANKNGVINAVKYIWQHKEVRILILTKLEDYKANLLRFLAKVGEDCQLYSGHNEAALPKDLIAEILSLCDEVLSGKTQNDTPYMPPFLKEAPADASMIEKLKMKSIIKVASKKQLGDAVPMEHKGVHASVQYNAKKIYRHDVQELDSV